MLLLSQAARWLVFFDKINGCDVFYCPSSFWPESFHSLCPKIKSRNVAGHPQITLWPARWKYIDANLCQDSHHRMLTLINVISSFTLANGTRGLSSLTRLPWKANFAGWTKLKTKDKYLTVPATSLRWWINEDVSSTPRYRIRNQNSRIYKDLGQPWREKVLFCIK